MSGAAALKLVDVMIVDSAPFVVMGTIAGAVPIPEFFSPENMRRVTGAKGR